MIKGLENENIFLGSYPSVRGLAGVCGVQCSSNFSQFLRRDEKLVTQLIHTRGSKVAAEDSPPIQTRINHFSLGPVLSVHASC